MFLSSWVLLFVFKECNICLLRKELQRTVKIPEPKDPTTRNNVTVDSDVFHLLCRDHAEYLVVIPAFKFSIRIAGGFIPC